MKKRFLLSLLMCGLLFSCNGKNNNNNQNDTPQSQNTSWEEDEQGLAFYAQDDGTYAVGVGTAFLLETVRVPSSYNGRAVTSVIKFGFSEYVHNTSGDNYFKFKSVFLPESIKTIEEGAFCESSLEYIKLPKSLEKIGDDVFNECPLKRIDYSGTYEDFCKISFGEDVFYDEYPGLVFKFSDGDRPIESFCIGAGLTTNIGYTEFDKDGNFFERQVGDSFSVSLPFSTQYFYFSKVYESFLSDYTVGLSISNVTIEDSSIVSASIIDNSGNLYLSPQAIGSTNISITSGEYTKNFVYTVVKGLPTTVTDLRALEDQMKGSARLYDIYCIHGFVRHTLDGKVIKDTKYGEEEISFASSDSYPEATDFREINLYIEVRFAALGSLSITVIDIAYL